MTTPEDRARLLNQFKEFLSNLRPSDPPPLPRNKEDRETFEAWAEFSRRMWMLADINVKHLPPNEREAELQWMKEKLKGAGFSVG